MNFLLSIYCCCKKKKSFVLKFHLKLSDIIKFPIPSKQFICTQSQIFKTLYLCILRLLQVDVTSVFAYIMSVKEESEINVIKKASQVSVDLFNKYLKDQILDVVDADKKVKHIKLSEGLLFIYLLSSFIIIQHNQIADWKKLT